MIYGAIDIGTNAARLLIGEVVEQDSASCVKKIAYFRVPLRLGFEVFNDGIISAKKIADFSKTIRAFKLISEVYNVRQLRACATSAMREALNGKEIQQFIKEQTGVEIEIIDGEQEAQLIFSTFMLLTFDKSVPFIVVDVGGGSTEISIFEGIKKIAGKSFKLGTIRMLQDKVDKEEWKKLSKWLKKNIDFSIPHKVFGTGGNINKIHKIFQRNITEGVKTTSINDLLVELRQMDLTDRMAKYNLKEDRADVIVPAGEIYLFIAKILGCEEYFVPKIGLSDGIIYNLSKTDLSID